MDAGLWNILIGMESGRDDALRRMHKMTTVDQNERALETLRRHGIEPNIGFIMFEPDSSLEDIRINFEFLQRNRLLTNLAITANLLYHHQIILMGTPAFKRLEQDGRLQQVNTSYEGMTAYSNPSVATLVELMRRITNIVFDRMDPVWSGREASPADGRQRYAGVNRLLVGWFDQLLRALQDGEQPGESERDAFVSQAEREIDHALGTAH